MHWGTGHLCVNCKVQCHERCQAHSTASSQSLPTFSPYPVTLSPVLRIDNSQQTIWGMTGLVWNFPPSACDGSAFQLLSKDELGSGWVGARATRALGEAQAVPLIPWHEKALATGLLPVVAGQASPPMLHPALSCGFDPGGGKEGRGGFQRYRTVYSWCSPSPPC